MKLTEMNINEYIALLGSDAPAPGGGSAAALSGAQGIALVTMVAGLTLGRKKYVDFTENCEDVIAKGTVLRNELVAQIDRDTEAFNLVSAAMKLPKETEEEKTTRRAAIKSATAEATKAPYYTMELCRDSMRLAKQMLIGYNTNCGSDISVGALNLRAGVYGAWVNVLINISGLDKEVADNYRAKGEAILAEVDTLYDEVYNAILAAL